MARVLAHPAFRKIPDCLFPLETEKARKEYGDLARTLFEAGHLTAAKHRALSSYALQFDTITRKAGEGKVPSAFAFVTMDKARKELGLHELDKPIAAPESTPVNTFARCGFSARRRQALQARRL